MLFVFFLFVFFWGRIQSGFLVGSESSKERMSLKSSDL